MKKIVIILILTLTVCAPKVNAQTIPVTDTMVYLQTIVTNKANYIGQPFSVLLNSLQIQVKYFFPFARLYKDKETSTSFSFYYPVTMNELYLTYPRLEIYWQPYLNKSQSDIIRQNNNNTGGWNLEAASFYSTAIIADIKLRN